MNRFRPFVLFFAALVLAACSGNNSNIVENDKLITVVVNKDESRRHDLMPSEAKKLLASLNLGPQARKIILFDVAAYVEYPDGWIIASGYGEWGGIVFWLSKNGDYQIIRDDDLAYPIDAMANQNSIFLLQGMNHLVISNGHLLEINRRAGEFETNIYPIEGYPRSFEKDEGKWTFSTDRTTYSKDDGKLTFSTDKITYSIDDIRSSNGSVEFQEDN